MTCYAYEDVRYLRDRHNDGCDDGDCSGCQQCGERHCPECRRGTHLGFGENTCPECIGKLRAALRDLVDLAAALPAEAEAKGVDSEAFNLNGPACDGEAWDWRRAAAAKRLDVPLSSLEEADQHHPVRVLDTWVRMLCEDYGDEYRDGVNVASMVAWLDLRLGRVAHDAGQDFGQLRRDVRTCRLHLEAVLHAGEQRDTGAPCMRCGVALERTWGTSEASDGWRCPRCRRQHSEAQYRFAVAHDALKNAELLNVNDLALRLGVKTSAIRQLAAPQRRWVGGDLVETDPLLNPAATSAGRKLYRVAEVQKLLGLEEVAG